MPAADTVARATALAERLIAFPTVSADSNLDLMDFVRAELESAGLTVRLTHDDSGRKANLFATLPGTGGMDGGMVLSGHTDVVPVADQPWSSDPFVPIRRDGRLYGRGSSDMKSFVACAMAMIPAFKSRRLPVPIHLAFTYDEEVGCFGAARLLDDLRDAGIKPALCIVGEPTLMRVANAHKSVHVFDTTVTGVAVHSSQPHRGANALMGAAKALIELDRVAETAKERARPETDYNPPWSTVHAGVMTAGTALNVVPRSAWFRWEIRSVPWDDAGAILADVRAAFDGPVAAWLATQHADAGIETRRVLTVPGLVPDPGGVAETLALAVTGQNRPTTVAFGTEAGLFQAAGIPTVICGPGSIDQAHQPDEWIELDQIAQCVDFLDRAASRLAS